MLISLRNVEKSYPHGVGRTYVLRRVNVDIKEGEFVSIMGPSGAGKSTLLHILGMHDSAWSGEYYFMDQPVHRLNPKQRAELHKKHIGFVFMKLLPNPTRPREDLWDAARIVPPGVSESFRLGHLAPGKPLVLLLRSAPTAKSEFDVLSAGKILGHVRLTPGDGWVETRVTLPPPGAPEIALVFGPSTTERALFQIWAVAAP